MNLVGTIVSASLLTIVGVQGAKIAATQAVGTAKAELRIVGRQALTAAELALDDGVLLDGPWGDSFCSLKIGDFDSLTYSREATATCDGLGQQVTITRQIPCASCQQSTAPEEEPV